MLLQRPIEAESLRLFAEKRYEVLYAFERMFFILFSKAKTLRLTMQRNIESDIFILFS